MRAKTDNSDKSNIPAQTFLCHFY